MTSLRWPSQLECCCTSTDKRFRHGSCYPHVQAEPRLFFTNTRRVERPFAGTERSDVTDGALHTAEHSATGTVMCHNIGKQVR